jgi:hypothetical protein
MKEIVTEIDVLASPARIWDVLTSFSSYSDWNPFLYRIDGTAEIGKPIKLSFRSSSSREMTLHCTITTLQPERALCWKYHIVLPIVYRGEHSFSIEPVDSQHSRFIQRERFNGLLVPLFSKDIDTYTRPDFEAMDQALKQRSEQGG